MPRFHTGPTAIARLGVAVTLAAGAALGSVGVVGAYPSPGKTASITSSCTSIDKGSSDTCTIKFFLEDNHGHLLDNHNVTFTVTGVSGASVNPTSRTTGADGTGEADTKFSPGDTACGTATITGTEGTTDIVTARTEIVINCSSGGGGGGGGGGGLLGGIFNTIFHNLLSTVVTTLTGGLFNGVLGGSGSAYTLTVPAGALPAGTNVSILDTTASDLAKVTGLLHPGDSLVSAFEIAWPTGVTSSSPVTFVIHNAAFKAGDRIYQVVGNALQLYPNSTIGDGVATVIFSGDPAFVVVAPAAAVPGGLGNEGLGSAAGSHPTGAFAIMAGTLLLLALVTVPVLRRRQSA